MMHRRDFLRRCALIAAGVVAADQLDLLEMLAPRRLFAGADLSPQMFIIDKVPFEKSAFTASYSYLYHTELVRQKDFGRVFI